MAESPGVAGLLAFVIARKGCANIVAPGKLMMEPDVGIQVQCAVAVHPAVHGAVDERPVVGRVLPAGGAVAVVVVHAQAGPERKRLFHLEVVGG